MGIDKISLVNLELIQKTDYQLFQRIYRETVPYFPNTRTIITAALSYHYQWNLIPENTRGYIARYTTANFYRLLSKKLKQLAAYIESQVRIPIPRAQIFRIFVNSRLDDKFFARISGLGTVLKNSLITIDQKGPRFVLGEILTIVPSQINCRINQTQNCLDCGQCIKACPTKALAKPYHINKDICLQHLSSQLHWPQKIYTDLIRPNWNKRFFGCTACIDHCPLNQNQPIIKENNALPGFIGTTFDPAEIFRLKKADYKKRFQKNQLSASWISPLALVRNALLLLYFEGSKKSIQHYIQTLPDYDWHENEQDYILEFCRDYLR